MRYTPVSGFPIIEPEEADPDIYQQYSDIQRETELPFIPSWAKMLVASPSSMDIYMTLYRAYKRNITLPEAVVPMILFCIADARNCSYCTAANEMYCRTLGVDEDTLEKMANDLDNVSPQRLRAIIQFALKCAFEPQALKAADYDRVREQGINDDEMMQIIFLAALANFNDTLADSFRIEVEPMVMEALGR